MKKWYFCLAAILLVSCGHKKEKNDLICMQIDDRNGFKETISDKNRLEKYKNTNFLSNQPYREVVRIYKNNISDKKNSKITCYHKNGMISQYLEVKKARAFGKYKKWYENGQIAVDANVIGGPASLEVLNETKWLFDKECRAWDEDGNQQCSFFYNKGLLDGDSIYYHKNGKTKKIVPYQNNKIEGKLVKYRKDGELFSETFYVEGLKNGVSKKIYKNGLCQAKEKYKKGKLWDGEYFDLKGGVISKIIKGNGKKTHFKKDNLSRVITYKKGVIDGTIEVFENGQVIREYIIKNDRKNGEEIEYYTSKNKDKKRAKLSINWVDDVIQGNAKTWYKNNQLQSQKEMYKNKKNGDSSAFYENGDLMFIEEYENDILIKGSYYKIHEKEQVSSVNNGKGIAIIYDGDGNFIQKIKYEKGMPQE